MKNKFTEMLGDIDSVMTSTKSLDTTLTSAEEKVNSVKSMFFGSSDRRLMFGINNVSNMYSDIKKAREKTR